MRPTNTIPSRLWTALDGYDIDRGFGRACPSCEREYEPGDCLIVILERRPSAAEWVVSSIVCAECGRRSFSEGEHRASADQALVSAELAVAGMTLVLDGETARLLERSPAIETDSDRA